MSKYKLIIALLVLGSLIGWFHIQLWRISQTPVEKLTTAEFVFVIVLSIQGWRVIEDFLKSKSQK